MVPWYGGEALLQLSERWPGHNWLVGSMKFASFETNLDGGWGLLVYPILLCSLPRSEKSPDMTEILLTGTQPIKIYRMPTKLNNFMFKYVYLI